MCHLLKKLRRVHPDHHPAMSITIQKKFELVFRKMTMWTKKKIIDMFSKKRKYLSCTHNCMFPKALLFIRASQELVQHFSLLTLIFKHFIQLLDQVALPAFRVLLESKQINK